MRNLLLISGFLLFTILSLFSSDHENPLVQSRKHNIVQAGAPEYINDVLLLTYEEKNPVRFVGAAFSHENFSKIHLFEKNQYSIFILSYKIPENIEKTSYRIVVDGLWMTDPNNNKSHKDKLGISLSFLDIPEPKRYELVSPIIHSQKMVEFLLYSDPKKMVTIIGDFNGWDPFTHRLTEIEPGVYNIKIKMIPGTHYYYYLVNGKKELDSLNFSKAENRNGDQVSFFSF